MTFSINLPEPTAGLQPFQAKNMPLFTLITGPNGTGKSNLLEAIKNNVAKVIIDGQVVSAPVHADAASILKLRPEAAQGRPAFAFSGNFIQDIPQCRRTVANRFQEPLKSKIIATVGKSAWGKLAKEEQSSVHLIESESNSEVANFVANRYGPSNGFYPVLQHASRVANLPIIFLTLDDVLAIPNWGKTDAFYQDISSPFALYRSLELENDLMRLRKDEGRSAPVPLSQEEFLAQFGPPPWDILNRVFSDCGLPFTVNEPVRYDNSAYLALVHDNGSTRTFDTLSSGEKVITALAMLAYRDLDKRQSFIKPGVVLLDEVDAPLHPSMCKTFLKVIEDVFINRLQIPVLLVTHSPSTVALFPGDRVFVMQRRPSALLPVTKDEAISALVADLPMLSLTYKGRRQVLCESKGDAEIFSAAYMALRPYLTPEISLDFVGTGGTSHPSNNTGSDVVKTLVQELRSKDARSVFGVIDYDGINQSGDGVVVLGEGSRYSVENVFLDPMLIISLVVFKQPEMRGILGIPAHLTISDFLSCEAPELQAWVNCVQDVVLGGATPNENYIEAGYVGGLSLQMRELFYKSRGHDLGDKILERMPKLKAKFASNASGSGGHMALMKSIADQVLREVPKYIPLPLLDVMREIESGAL